MQWSEEAKQRGLKNVIAHVIDQLLEQLAEPALKDGQKGFNLLFIFVYIKPVFLTHNDYKGFTA